MLRFSMETGVMNTDNKMCNISLTSSMEDYLEAVLVLQQKHGYIRCVDVAGSHNITIVELQLAARELQKWVSKVVVTENLTLTIL